MIAGMASIMRNNRINMTVDAPTNAKKPNINLQIKSFVLASKPNTPEEVLSSSTFVLSFGLKVIKFPSMFMYKILS